MKILIKIYSFIFSLLLVAINLDAAKAIDQPPEIIPENQVYDAQYFSITIPKGWVAKEVYGHEDLKPGQDGLIVFYNNMGEHIDIFSVSFYDPQYPQYNIIVSVESNVEILKKNNDKSINTAFLQRYFEQHDFNSFSSHNRPGSLGELSAYESTLGVSNEQGRYLTYDGKRVDTDHYIYVIEHYIYNNFSDRQIARLDKIINSFHLKSQSLSVSDISPQTAEDYLNRGFDYQNQGNLIQALFDYDKALEINPSFAKAYNNRGVVYTAQGSFIQAMSDFSKALEINPNDSRIYYNRGAMYLNQGKFTQAMSEYNKAIEINPHFAMAYHDRGFLYDKQGDFIQAMSDYNKAIEINPNDEASYNNRGLLFYNQNNYNRAMSDYNKELEINPDCAEAYNNRAYVYYRLEKYDNAWTDLHKAEALGMTIDPSMMSALKQVSGRDR